MPLQIYDTLRHAKVPFEPNPKTPGRITLYVCGPTVYSYAHIGNARPAVVFDVLFRLLQRLYPDAEVVYARNVTDVDDKINAAATAEGVDISVVTDKFSAIYERDMAALNVLAPTYAPRATAYMPQMTALIEQLIAAEAAYVSQDEVLFDVPRYEANGGDYGALSGRALDDLLAGARVEVAGNKKSPADFVLWKPSKAGEPAWDGPQGLKGRPGWHIECSAMSEAVLGLPIDIHGGGHDLIFPHHTNEIAQSCAAHGVKEPAAYARYWMHNGFLDMSGEKMSKSLGNGMLIHDLVKQYPGEVLRWALLSGHYRSPLDWTPAVIAQSQATLDRLYQSLREYPHHVSSSKIDPALYEPDHHALALEALRSDLNTPLALGHLASLAANFRAALVGFKAGSLALDSATALRKQILDVGALLGVLQQDPDAWFEGGADDDFKAKIDGLLKARHEARAAKDFATADRIRGELDALNVMVMDGPAGATWRMKE